MAQMTDNSSASAYVKYWHRKHTGKRLNRARSRDSVDSSTLCFLLIRKVMTHRPTQAVLPLV